MTQSPFSSALIAKAKLFVQRQRVGQVLFSEGTYQVEIIDKKEIFWPVLQIGDDGDVKDRLCSCSASEQGQSCFHQAAAWLKIVDARGNPLHVRFQRYFWNRLCKIYACKHGYDTQVLHSLGIATFELTGVTNKRLFFASALTPHGKKVIRDLIAQRPKETEETSLKFSNLSSEELLLWRQGRPSEHLQYELSFWSDIAKFLFLMQEAQQSYQVEYIPIDTLPKTVIVKTQDIRFEFYIAEADWLDLIPSLNTVQSRLQVESYPQIVKRIIYDPLRQEFFLDTENIQRLSKEREEMQHKLLKIGEWLFDPAKGFVAAKPDAWIKNGIVPKEQVSLFLLKHKELVKEKLVGTSLHDDAVAAKYHLFFDIHHSLHVACYVLAPGDLQQKMAAYFSPWAFLPGHGFYLLKNLLFEEAEFVVPQKKISEFITRHRQWLGNFPGFETHVRSVESKLSYHLNSDHSLQIDGQLEYAEETEDILDCGDWIYIKNRGFFPKATRIYGQQIKPGIVVAGNQVDLFIRSNREELENIPRFFMQKSPLVSSGLQIFLDEQKQIIVRPEYRFHDEYIHKHVVVFSEYTFVEGEGFCEIPANLKIRSPYHKECFIEPESETYFIGCELDLLYPQISSIDPQLKEPKNLVLEFKTLSIDDGTWELDFHYRSEFGSISGFDVWQALQGSKRYLFSPAGLIMFRQVRFDWLKGIAKKRWQQKGVRLQISTLDLIRLLAFENIVEPLDSKSYELFCFFRDQKTKTTPVLEGLQSTLRGYQERGLQWLWFLYQYGLSGLLCDEMGLGKTHQAMALLAAAHHERAGKFLVVCPTSVILHWEYLLARFLPTLRVLIFHGAKRNLAHLQTEIDIVVTSFGTLRSEQHSLSEHLFDVAIFDEIQIAKNHKSLTHKALKMIQAKMRLGLTGTPIENRLLELKSLFDVVLPTYMPQAAIFRDLFVYPIEKQGDQSKKQLLNKLIHPFILRRKKSEVLQELPEKIEEIAYTSLSDEQQKLYREMYQISRNVIVSDLENRSQPIPYIHIFSLLTKLKQICDHPALIYHRVEGFEEYASGKWDFFVELLQEARDSGQKVVVFSQYLGMLDIIELYLSNNSIGFASLRGSTHNRKEQVEKFRDDPACEVFVGSLQAAGVGIDLVSASVVIHYDRWWNPAKENQATDRVHRIGQSRGVQVFKMVSKGTIEEHIHHLIERKKTLIEDIIGYDDQDQLKSLSRDELIELVRLMDQDLLNEQY